MPRPTLAREVALQMLFQLDLNPDVTGEDVRAMIAESLRDAKLREFAWRIVSGVMECRGQLDARIQAVAENWTVDRMTVTDRNALRIGTFELCHTDTPPRVAIDEAIELAKKFGTQHSSQFVNGLLDRILHSLGPSERESPGSS